MASATVTHSITSLITWNRGPQGVPSAGGGQVVRAVDGWEKVTAGGNSLRSVFPALRGPGQQGSAPSANPMFV